MDKAIQQKRSTVTGIKPVGIAMALQPRCRGVVDATGRQMKRSYLLRVRIISGSSEIGFKVVSVPSQAQTSAIIINLSKVRVERPVFLHHENNVVHALKRTGRSGSGRCR